MARRSTPSSVDDEHAELDSDQVDVHSLTWSESVARSILAMDKASRFKAVVGLVDDFYKDDYKVLLDSKTFWFVQLIVVIATMTLTFFATKYFGG